MYLLTSTSCVFLVPGICDTVCSSTFYQVYHTRYVVPNHSWYICTGASAAALILLGCAVGGGKAYSNNLCPVKLRLIAVPLCG